MATRARNGVPGHPEHAALPGNHEDLRRHRPLAEDQGGQQEHRVETWYPYQHSTD